MKQSYRDGLYMQEEITRPVAEEILAIFQSKKMTFAQANEALEMAQGMLKDAAVICGNSFIGTYPGNCPIT
jgi:hypothetical protein